MSKARRVQASTLPAVHDMRVQASTLPAVHDMRVSDLADMTFYLRGMIFDRDASAKRSSTRWNKETDGCGVLCVCTRADVARHRVTTLLNMCGGDTDRRWFLTSKFELTDAEVDGNELRLKSHEEFAAYLCDAKTSIVAAMMTLDASRNTWTETRRVFFVSVTFGDSQLNEHA
jgi:hypothetical protein